MSAKQAVLTDKAPAPLPVFSQAIVHNGIVYCSGQVGTDPATRELVEGTVKDRTVCLLVVKGPVSSNDMSREKSKTWTDTT